MKLSSAEWKKLRHHLRKHDHFRVTVTYSDNGQSAKVFTDKERAEKFAARQTKSPVVKSAKVVKLD